MGLREIAKAATVIVVAHAPLLAVVLLGYVPLRPWGAVLLGIVGFSLLRKCATTWANLMPGDLRGKHVVITGGSQGLGKALAALCVAEGATVTLVARSPDKLQAAARELGPELAKTLTLDVAKASSTDFDAALDAATRAVNRRVDIFIANAGTGHARLVLDDPNGLDEYVSGLVDLNAKGSLLAVAAAARHMARDGKGGRICLVSSAAGVVSLPGYSFYSATKFGHRGALAGAYHELRRYGVLLSCFFPGSILTPGYYSELDDRPDVTHRIESTCSDTAAPPQVAAALLAGLKAGSREFSNELLPTLLLDDPTGCLHLDLLVALIVIPFKLGWDFYLDVVSRSYLPRQKGHGTASAKKRL